VRVRSGESHQFQKASSAGFLKDSGRVILRTHFMTFSPVLFVVLHNI